ncbi:MAG: hypothetical protein ACFFCM_17460 [Promethearchaeota archaeon]
MLEENLEIVRSIFNWLEIEEHSEKEIKQMADRLKFPLEDKFLINCSWSYFKKCTVANLGNEPLLFFKYVREHYIEEVLGLHLTKHFFDPELCFKNFLTGIEYKKKKAIPYITTTYERGDNIGHKKYNILDFKYQLGRQCYLHEVLCLYDVYDRHFIVRNDDSLCRIDFGRCFENLDKNYLGFDDYLKSKHLDFHDAKFQEGYNFEKQKIRNNLENKKENLAEIIRNIRNLEKDYDLITIDPKKLCNKLLDHWSRINFVEDVNISECE